MPTGRPNLTLKGNAVAGLTVTLRGIRYRAGRSLVVFILATVATTAAVLAPAYARAAEQSALADELRALPATSAGLTIVAGRQVDAGVVDSLPSLVTRRHTLSAALGRPYVGATGTVELSSLRATPVSPLVYRGGSCAHLTITTGSCPGAGSTGILLSAATAERYGVRVGEVVTFGGHGSAAARTHPVVGLYQVRGARQTYWWGHSYFTTGQGTDADPRARLNAVFTGDPDAPRSWSGVSGFHAELDYPVDVGRITMDQVPALRAELAALTGSLDRWQIRLTTALPDTFDAATAQQRTILDSVPVVAVPLVLLCWFVLYLMVASLTEERGPEIALARLRGFRPTAAVRFGLGEALALIVVAAPVGVAAGLGVVAATARLVLAPGTPVELRAPVFAIAAVALAGAVLAAVLAARRTMKLPTMALLRRVPERGRWRANVVEGALVALAAAALYQVLSDPTSRLALLAPPLLAFVAGLVAARLVGFVAGRRLRAAHGRLRPAALLAYAQLARRPIAQRIVLTVTVAVSLLSFAVTAWDVAGHNRQRAAAGEVGAATVYTVAAAGPHAVRDAVDHIDPSGHYLMAAMQSDVTYDGGTVSVLAVDPGRLSAAATWPGRSAAQVATLAGRLGGHAPASAVTVRGPISLRVHTDGLPAGKPMSVAVTVAAPDQPPAEVLLGTLRAGTHDYTGALPGCSAGCQLVGVGLTRYAADFSAKSATITVSAVHDAGGSVAIGLGKANRWSYSPTDGADGTVKLSGAGGLRIDYSGAGADDPIITYLTAPDALPAVLAGPAPADSAGADSFSFPAFGTPVPFRVTARADVIPRAGNNAMLVDLAAVRQTMLERPTTNAETAPTYQVWAGAGAPADLAGRLSAAGLPVLRTDSQSDTLDRLGRQAPALALRLYLIAGFAALLLAIGTVGLTAYVGAGGRLYELAALRVVGVGAGELRRGMHGEYRVLLGVPLLVGLAAGAAGAVLMLPTIRLVTSTDAGLHRVYELGAYWVPGTVAVTVAALVAAAVAVSRRMSAVRPDRIRSGGR